MVITSREESGGVGKLMPETFLDKMKEQEKNFRWDGEEVAKEVAYLWELKKV
jgi:hypothetical protein